MKKFKFILLFVAVGFSFSAIAQFSFGPKIGLNLATYSFNFKDSDDEPDVKMRLAPLVGFAINYQFTDELALQSGLFFSGKGTAFDLEKLMADADDVDIDGYMRFSTGYLEIPVNIAYGIAIGESQLQIFAGPYLAYGIMGEMKWDYTVKSGGDSETLKDDIKIKFKNKIDESDDEEDTMYQTALDLGLGFGLGFKTGPILINAGYGLGLTNLEPKWGGDGEDDRDDWKYTNGVINVSVSYLFGGE
ncbi:MAG: PorT family protein [Bacteroidetes bacterium]|nr:PorT family protein [Bacteroidota bacterium]